jgi:hypothetical protein
MPAPGLCGGEGVVDEISVKLAAWGPTSFDAPFYSMLQIAGALRLNHTELKPRIKKSPPDQPGPAGAKGGGHDPARCAPRQEKNAKTSSGRGRLPSFSGKGSKLNPPPPFP